MKNRASVWCYISGIIAFCAGVVYSLSLLFIPIAIYLFIYASRYFSMAKLSDGEFSYSKPILVSQAVVVSIFAFPFGLISLIPMYIAGSHNIKITNSERINNQQTEHYEEPIKADVSGVTTIQEEDNQNIDDEKLEKIEKLARFRKQGLLTQEEFEEAKNKLLNE